MVYREAAHVIVCPRCDDVFDEIFEGVSACVRCNGMWIAQPAIDRAFSDPMWPPGPSAWWRRELSCPVCASEGKLAIMVPVLDGTVVVDRCRGHGVWLDEGELGRVLGVPDGLAVLYARLFGTDMPTDLQRSLTGSELAQRRRQASEHKAWLDRVMADAKQAADEARKRRTEWAKACEDAKAEVGGLEAKLVRIRTEVRQCEHDLAAARVRLQQLESKPPPP
jgi:Zn-finger nucleic acid-binding protein